MKSALETLTATRVRLTVEVPFEELRASVDAAYRKIAGQVRVQGFRPGRVPPRILDQRVGRGVVLEQAVQDAVPRFYGDAVRENDLQVLGHPEVEVSEFADGSPLVFTAEVEVRPQVVLPDHTGLPVTVDPAEVTDEEVDEQLSGLRERFAVLRAADRPAQPGDFVSLDLSATADGEPLPEAATTGLSYEVGSASLVPGLDEALAGAAEGETRQFDTQLVGGPQAGRTAAVSATVRSVKTKDVPALDDEFARTASEFDTIEELRADVRDRLARVKRLQQGVQARDRALDALLERTDVPLPEGIVEAETQWRRTSMNEQLEAAGLTREAYLAAEGRTEGEIEAEIADGARQAVRAQLVLDALAAKEQLGVTEAELTEQVVRRAQRAGVAPDAYAQQLVSSGQLGAVMSEVLRGKALALVLESAVVTDTTGRRVDLEALREEPAAPAAAGPGSVRLEDGEATGPTLEATAETDDPAASPVV